MRTPDSGTQVGTVARRIGANVKRLRMKHRWSLGRLADEAGLARALIWKIEQGAPRTPVAQLQPIASALGVTLDVLAGPANGHRPRRSRNTGRRTARSVVAARILTRS